MIEASMRLALGTSLTVLSVSTGIESLLGFSSDDFLSGRVTLKARIHPHDQDIADTLFARNAESASGIFNIRLRQANGRIRCVRGEYQKNATETGGLVLELQLQDARSLPRTLDDASVTTNFRAMMENTDDYIYFKDRNHVFTGASQTLVSICAPAEHWTDLLGQTDYDVFPEEYADIYYRLEKQVFAGVPVAHEVQETLTNDGQHGWVDNRKYPIWNEQGEIIGLYGIARDITERMHEQDMLRKSEERYRSLLNNLPSGVVVHGADTSILLSNAAAASFLGLTEEQMLGKTAIDPEWCFLHENGTPLPLKDYPVNLVIASGERVPYLVIGVQGPDCSAPRWFLCSAYPMRDEEGELLQVVVIFTDITERKQAEAELLRHRSRLEALVEERSQALARAMELNVKLEEAHHQLLQSEKMASIGQLAAGVAHEINNPVGFVSSNLHTLGDYHQDIFAIIDAYASAENGACRQCRYLDEARSLKRDRDFDDLRADTVQILAESKEGLDRIAKIVIDLKDFSRPGETTYQWADLHQGLDSTLNIVWNELKYKCVVRKEYGELPLIRCVPAQLNQVFMNLLLNASHAIPKKGEITIRTGYQDGEVLVAISDTGTGIAPEHSNRLFEPFFTTKPVGKGTGLGLSLSYGIVQKHQGRIDVQSELGKGSTFTVWLPIDPLPTDSTYPEPPMP